MNFYFLVRCSLSSNSPVHQFTTSSAHQLISSSATLKGKLTSNLLPFPVSLLTFISPLCASTIARA
jgi:hypothetical protein